MKITLYQEQIEIERNRSVVLRNALGVEVVCVRGCLWLTEDGRQVDHMLRPGDSRVVRGTRRVFVTALEPSAMRALEPLRRQRESAWSRVRSAVVQLAAIGARGFVGRGERGAGS